jgi:hypothetical protein
MSHLNFIGMMLGHPPLAKSRQAPLKLFAKNLEASPAVERASRNPE